MKPKKKRTRFKMRHRRVGMPSYPPPVSINPWRRVTLSLEDEGTSKDKCVKVSDIMGSLSSQLTIAITRTELKVHRVRLWNRGSPPTYNATNKVEIPATAGPLCLNACDLVANMARTDCSVTMLKTIESYPGRASWAKASYTWGSPSNRLIIGSSNDKAIVYTWRAPVGETVVHHIVVSYRSAVTGSFTESTLRPTHATSDSCPSSPFERMEIRPTGQRDVETA